MKNENPAKEPPSLAEVFEKTRERKEGRKYKETAEEIAAKVAEMKAYALGEVENPVDPFIAVMGKEKNGRCRLLGRGVFEKKVKEVTGKTSYVVPGAAIDELRSSILEEVRKEVEVDKMKLAEMYKTQEEENLRKKAELEKMKAELEKQRGQMTEDILTKIIGKLPPDVVMKYLCSPSGSSSRPDE